MREWAKIAGLNYKTLLNRLKHSEYNLEKAIFYEQEHQTNSIAVSYAITLMRDKYLEKRAEEVRRRLKGPDSWKETKYVVTGSGAGYYAPVNYEEWYTNEKIRRLEWDHEYAMDTYKVRAAEKR